MYAVSNFMFLTDFHNESLFSFVGSSAMGMLRFPDQTNFLPSFLLSLLPSFHPSFLPLLFFLINVVPRWGEVSSTVKLTFRSNGKYNHNYFVTLRCLFGILLTRKTKDLTFLYSECQEISQRSISFTQIITSSHPTYIIMSL